MSKTSLTSEIARLREDLIASGFTTAAIKETLGDAILAEAKSGAPWNARKLLARSLSDASDSHFRLSVFISLFVIGDMVPEPVAARAFESFTIEDAKRVGILKDGVAGTVAPGFSITPHETMLTQEPQTVWIISDLDDHLRKAPLGSNHVMGIGGATLSLLSAIPQKEVVYSADIGTGNGIIALELAKISKRVLATDVSKRALTFAKLNAELNQISNIYFAEGSLLDPLAKQKFDLIVSNPPFVISPAGSMSDITYRSSDSAGDQLLKNLTANVHEYLYDDGLFVSLGNWESDLGLDSSDLSNWVIERGSQTPLQYVETWLRDGGILAATPEYNQNRKEWLADFAQRNITAITYGYIFIFNSVQKTQVQRKESIHSALSTRKHFGNSVFEGLNESVKLAQLNNTEILETRFLKQEGVYELRTLIPGTENIIDLTLVKSVGIERHTTIDTAGAAFFGACDGELTAGQIAHALAELLEIDYAKLEKQLLHQIKEFIWLGMLKIV